MTDLEGSLDLVYSIGVVEHCEDPRNLVLAHLKWLNERGVAIILIPNYSGVNRYLQHKLDPQNLEIHNLDLMRLDYWQALEKRVEGFSLAASYFGHPSPWLLSLQRYGVIGRMAQYALNFLFFLFPTGTRLSGSILIIGRRR